MRTIAAGVSIQSQINGIVLPKSYIKWSLPSYLLVRREVRLTTCLITIMARG